MKVYNFQKTNKIPPKLSIVLIDWSCRESLHVLDYLSNQKVPRNEYEVIWVEYYSRRSAEIDKRLRECESSGKPPVVDKWIIMEMPESAYFHKHLMYNVGIVASEGKIITTFDSDAMVMPTFVESVIKEFERDPNIVLYLDEVRNHNTQFYPFNYPSTEEVEAGAVNWSRKHRTTTGILDEDDPFHTRNYGGCTCALREDLINIGGADEHVDFLGYICGPYDFGFRLVNAGKKEIWHQKELLYHVWHPGSVGVDDYMGPHDGYNMSSIAMDSLMTKRVMPIVENPVTKMFRLGKGDEIDLEHLLLEMVSEDRIKDWVIDENKRLISSGRAAFYRGEYDEALKCWEEVLKNVPDEKVFLSEMGWAYYHKSSYDKALSIFNEVTKQDENNLRALKGQAWTNLRIGNFKESINKFHEYLQFKKYFTKNDLRDSFRELGWAYCHNRCFEEAIQSFEKALKNSYSSDKPALQDVFRGLGWTYYHKGDFDKAINSFRLAVKNINPADKGLMQNACDGLNSAYQAKNGKGNEKRVRFIVFKTKLINKINNKTKSCLRLAKSLYKNLFKAPK